MKELQQVLMKLYCLILFLSVAEGVAFCLWDFHPLQDAAVMQYYYSLVAVIGTLAVVPLALRLFKWQTVADRLQRSPVEELRQWAIFRMTILAGFLQVNILGIFLFGAASYVYLSLILAVAFLFIYPSLERCQEETGFYED